MVSGPYFTGASRGHFRISLLWMLEGHLEKEPTEATAGQWSLIIRLNYQVLSCSKTVCQKFFYFFGNNIMIDLRNISNKIKIRDQSLIKCSTSSADKAKATIFKRIIYYM